MKTEMAEVDVAELQQLFDSVEAKQHKCPDMNEDLRLGFASNDFAGTKWKNLPAGQDASLRVLQTSQLHLQLQETVFLPGRADGGHVLPRVGQQVDLRARVVVPEGYERSHQFREGARDGDVVLRHARRHRGLLRVHRGVAEHERPS